MSEGKGSRKIGRMKRKGGWAHNGGPGRMARRKARNHGCGKPAMHLKPADLAHSGMR